MTTDDLQSQKDIAIAELREAEAAAGVADDEYDAVKQAVGMAANVLSAPIVISKESELRHLLSGYARYINMEIIVDALNKKNATAAAVAEAKRKLAVFR